MTAFELYSKIGFNHILDERLFTNTLAAEGYDHLLFVIALAAVYTWREYKQVLILVSAFTIGHSVTLLLATLDLVRVSMPLIEFLIPLTIVLTALFNLLKHPGVLETSASRLRYWAALLFGLIHGLGFSNYLKALLGNEDSIVTPLLAFNIGLELGQIVIVVFTLMLYFLLNKLTNLHRKAWIISVSLIVLALTLPILWETGRGYFGISFIK